MTRKMVWFLMAAIAALVLAPVTFAQGGAAASGTTDWIDVAAAIALGHHGGGLRSRSGTRDSGSLRRHGAESGRQRPHPHRVHHRRGADRVADAVCAGYRSDQVVVRGVVLHREGLGPDARMVRASGLFLLCSSP